MALYNYRTYQDLSKTIWRAIPTLPKELDLVVGVPRSGLIPATMLALYLNLSITTLDSFLDGKVCSSGLYRTKDSNKKINEYKSILILDDSYCSGRAMRKVHSEIASSGILKTILAKIYYGAVYISPESSPSDIDFAFEICPMPRLFQWNIFNHSVNSSACFDIDGVACQDPTQNENDDGECYRNFIKNARPHFATIHPISRFVSSRLEKYRNETEIWLKQSNYQFGKVELLNLPNKEARIKAQCHGQFKAQIYKEGAETLFYESNATQAKEIYNLTQKDVFCTETMEMLPSRVVDKDVISALLEHRNIHIISDFCYIWRQKAFDWQYYLNQSDDAQKWRNGSLLSPLLNSSIALLRLIASLFLHPLWHYLRFGEKRAISPCTNFNPHEYLAMCNSEKLKSKKSLFRIFLEERRL